MPLKPGQTNNRAGRPPGRGAVAQLRQAILNGDKLKDLVDVVLKRALAGDMRAARLLLDRAVPALRAQAAPLPGLELPAGTLTERAQSLLEAACAGRLPTDTAAELITAIGRLVQIEQGDELRRRLDAFEHGDIA